MDKNNSKSTFYEYLRSCDCRINFRGRLHVDYVIPDSFDRRVAAYVAATVAYAAMETGVSQKNINVVEIKQHLLTLTEEQHSVFV